MKNILLVCRRGIGDMVWSVPLINSLHSAFPDAHIDIPATETTSIYELITLFGDHVTPIPYPDSNHPFRKAEIKAHKAGDRLMKHTYHSKLLEEILPHDYDLAIFEKGNMLNQAGEVVPYRINRISGKQISTSDIREDTLPVDRYLQFATAAGIPARHDFSMGIDMERDARLYDGTVLPDSNYVVLCLQAGQPEKKWTKEGFQTVIKHFQQRGLDTILVGGPEEENLARELPATKNTVTDHYSISLADFARLAYRSEMVISGDTGFMHLADAVGAKVIGMFGPTPSAIFAPYHNTEYAVQAESMEQLRPEQVTTQIDRIL
ncbi:MAG: glycosyltransferase family 9 protein [Nanoarchaeota archaeon]|nr:glycosyltransferase family 9 protein [Nanoarchaeota archaeon]MBU1975886.1 glycosyltransferase family 9 protein [Nanoarchaeota archaeon]